jgi:hypothetical protein
MRLSSRRIRLLVGACVAVALGLAASAGAVVTPRIGTPSSGITARTYTDTYINFTTVDTGQVAGQAGWVTRIDYYAQHTGTIGFLLFDSSNVVEWVSDPISVTSTGAASDVLSTPPSVGVGWQLGYWTSGTGVVPFDCGGPTVLWNGFNAGFPAVGSTFHGVNTPAFCSSPEHRTYSMGADILSSMDQCTDGGWTDWGVFDNQGDCVSFVATDGTNPPGIGRPPAPGQ